MTMPSMQGPWCPRCGGNHLALEPCPAPPPETDERQIAQLPPHVLAGFAPASSVPRRGHAAPPGTGPQGERCRSCAHAVRVQGNTRNFAKCGLMRDHWTHGPGSDIRLRDPSCRFWSAKP